MTSSRAAEAAVLAEIRERLQLWTGYLLAGRCFCREIKRDGAKCWTCARRRKDLF